MLAFQTQILVATFSLLGNIQFFILSFHVITIFLSDKDKKSTQNHTWLIVTPVNNSWNTRWPHNPNDSCVEFVCLYTQLCYVFYLNTEWIPSASCIEEADTRWPHNPNDSCVEFVCLYSILLYLFSHYRVNTKCIMYRGRFSRESMGRSLCDHLWYLHKTVY